MGFDSITRRCTPHLRAPAFASVKGILSVRERDSPELFARVQEGNLLRQYDLLLNCIEIGLVKGIESFDKYTLWSLNAAAVANIAQFGGRYRRVIYVGDHLPPHFEDVPDEMGRAFSLWP